ncbi:MAG TPA: cupin domain-containing protein [Caulobacteraceae bacterium]|nr:cupin domain-containing protein [Caulobacteraceae bacterium]
MADDPKHLVRTGAFGRESGVHGRHPFNPNSEMYMTRLSERTGLKRLPVNLMRLPPSKESFIPHAHSVEEEWVFVIEGEGTVTLDGVATAIGAGDFIGFPNDGVVHHMTNTHAADDLVYLTGGEHAPVEIAHMPTIGKVAVFKDSAVTFYDEDTGQRVTMAEWFERAKIAEG